MVLIGADCIAVGYGRGGIGADHAKPDRAKGRRSRQPRDTAAGYQNVGLGPLHVGASALPPTRAFGRRKRRDKAAQVRRPSFSQVTA